MSKQHDKPLFDQDKPKVIDAFGVKVTISPTVFDDWHVLEMVADMDGDNVSPSTLIRFLRKLFGDEQYKRVMDELTDEDGRLPVEKVTEFLRLIMEQLNPNS